ncbi:MAG: protein kinase [Myxococcota bacterium]
MGESDLEGVPEPGTIILDKFRIDRVIGRGGMGCVVAATHLQLEQRIAIKFLLRKSMHNPDNLVRFQREARAAARIQNDHVARVSDVGVLEDGTPFMVMEYLEGSDLGSLLKRRGQLNGGEAAALLLQTCEAVAAAHAEGVIHRDLKPENLFITHLADGSPRIKVLDFGISKVDEAEAAGLTQTAALVGSPRYMSPEQMTNARAVDERTDIWSLGCILYESVSGKSPFEGSTLPQICSAILSTDPIPLLKVAPTVDSEMATIVEACLHKDPVARFANVKELALRLAPFAPVQAATSLPRIESTLGLTLPLGTPSSAAARGLETDPTIVASPQRGTSSSSVGAITETPVSQTLDGPPPRRSWLVAAVAVGALVGIAATVATRHSSPPKKMVGPAPASSAIAAPTPSPAATAVRSASAATTKPLRDASVARPPIPVVRPSPAVPLPRPQPRGAPSPVADPQPPSPPPVSSPPPLRQRPGDEVF